VFFLSCLLLHFSRVANQDLGWLIGFVVASRDRPSASQALAFFCGFEQNPNACRSGVPIGSWGNGSHQGVPTENSVWSLAGPFRPHVTMLHVSNKLPEQRSSTWILLILWPLDRGDIFGEPQSLILHRRRGYCSFRVQLVAARHTARQKWLRARLDTKRTGRASSLGARTPCEMRHDVGYETGRRREGTKW